MLLIQNQEWFSRGISLAVECPLFRRKTIPVEFPILRNSVFNGIQRIFTEFRHIIPVESKNSAKFRRNSVLRNSAADTLLSWWLNSLSYTRILTEIPHLRRL